MITPQRENKKDCSIGEEKAKLCRRHRAQLTGPDQQEGNVQIIK